MENQGLRCIGPSGSIAVILELDFLDLSGFEVLVQLVPIARRLNVAVVTHSPEASRVMGFSQEKWGLCLPSERVYIRRGAG
jgi:hypothetical protein